MEVLSPADTRGECKALRSSLLKLQKVAGEVETAVRYGTVILTTVKPW